MKNRSLFLFFTTIYIIITTSNTYSENTFSIQTLTTKDGLSQNTIRSITQDGQGFLWFGTLNGLNRYDGNDFICLHPQYGLKNTISDSRIKKILKDSYGYLWIRTNVNNINCYDPITQKFIDIHPWSTKHEHIFFTKNGDVWLWGRNTGCLIAKHTTNGLSTHFFGYRELNDYNVNILYEDSDSNVWLGTDTGLFRYENDKLTKIVSDSSFCSIMEVNSLLYVGTSTKIYKIDRQSQKIVDVIHFNLGTIKNTFLLTDGNILITTRGKSYIFYTKLSYFKDANKLFNNKTIINASVRYDNKDNIWIYNKSGIIWRYIASLNQFKPYSLMPTSKMENIDMERYCIYHDSRDIIWITTYGNGLFAIDEKTGIIHHFTRNNPQQEGLGTDYLLTVYEDKSHNIWVGSEHSGVSKITITENKHHAFYPEGNKSKAEDRIIRLVHEDSNQNLWIGTKSGYIYIYDKDRNLIDKHHLSGGMPYSLEEDRSGNIWIGTKANGLLIFKKNEYHTFYSFNSEFKNLNHSSNNIYALKQDNKGRMWLGTFGSGLILAKFNNDSLTLRNFPSINKYQKRIRTIELDNYNHIWLGGNDGITAFDPDLLIINQANIKNFNFDSKNDSSLNNNEVKTIFKDSNNNLWVGTSGGGLNLILHDSKKLNNIQFKHLSISNGLINNIIQGISEDDNKNLWITTESGISVMHLKDLFFENFHLSKRWEADLFCESAICKSKTGKMLLGCYDGLYNIAKEDLASQTNEKTVTLTGFKINGNKVFPGEKDSPLDKSISVCKDIHLTYYQNSFNISFSALNFKTNNVYTYILDGYEKEWNSSTRNNDVTFRNIPPGNYTFRVKTSNTYGKQKETKLNITIDNPLWKSSKAMVFYFILLSFIIFILRQTYRKIYKLDAAIKLEQQVTEYKLQFFTNVSHEFRTPLMIIKGAIENIASQPNISTPIRKQINYLEKSSKRLLRLINQLLDYQKIQYGQSHLSTQNTEIISFFNSIYQNFKEQAQRKNINYQFDSQIESFDMAIDPNKIEIVLYNLLSNAFKFSHQNGSVILKISIDSSSNLLKFSVSDTGEGISQEFKNSLFKRFQQMKPSNSGTGIGLNYSYELIKLHGGNIEHEDTPNGGATFKVSVPILNIEMNKESVKANKHINDFYKTIPTSNKSNAKAKNTPAESPYIDSRYKNHKLLIIEDDMDVSEFLSDFLTPYFTIETALDGLDGLIKCKQINPHIIICDAMMPKINGFDLIKQIKSEFQFCHIPIIMLTAYSSDQHQLRGIASGADSYITKPFDTQYLLTTITKLLEQREILHRKFSKEPDIQIDPQLPANKDNEFVNKINLIIEKNIDNPDFSMTNFYENLSMGRTVFYKKVKTLTGFTPNEYLRVMRMKKAAELLKTTQLNISEIAFNVGINNPFYFSKCFKEQFGVSPSEFAKGKSSNK